MKKIYTILLLTILLGTLVVGCHQETVQPLDAPIESKTYENIEYGFSLSYPDNWELKTLIFDEEEKYVVYFGKESEVLIQVWVLFKFKYIPLMLTLDDQYKLLVRSWSGDYKDFEILDEHDMTVDGLPARSITVTFTSGDILRKETMILVVKEIPYVIIYMPTGSYDNYFDHFNLVVDTFKFEP